MLHLKIFPSSVTPTDVNVSPNFQLIADEVFFILNFAFYSTKKPCNLPTGRLHNECLWIKYVVVSCRKDNKKNIKSIFYGKLFQLVTVQFHKSHQRVCNHLHLSKV